MPPPQPVVGSRFVLEIGTARCGLLKAADGGEGYAEVLAEGADASGVVRKHLGAARFADITLRFANTVTDDLFKVIEDLLDRQFRRIAGAVVGVDQANRERSRLEFSEAVVTEFTLPELDGASRELGELMLRLAPGKTTSVKGSNQPVAVAQNQDRPWHLSNFRLRIDGLDCSRVRRIDRMSFTKPNESSSLTVPDLVVTLSAASAEGWEKWHEDFVIRGDNGPGKEKTGTLELLAPNMSTVLMTVTFAGLGISRLQRVAVVSGTDAIPMLRASLYIEQVAFAAH